MTSVVAAIVALGAGSVVAAFLYFKRSAEFPWDLALLRLVIENSQIGDNSSIGPFAHVGPGAELEQGVEVGNFVEIKRSKIGKKTKAKHLAYIGDGALEAEINVGAGTIFVNYDGKNKNKTKVGSNAFIGSNSSLVAPLIIGKNSMIGAGSVITKNVSANKLALGRSKQRNIKKR